MTTLYKQLPSLDLGSIMFARNPKRRETVSGEFALNPGRRSEDMKVIEMELPVPALGSPAHKIGTLTSKGRPIAHYPLVFNMLSEILAKNGVDSFLHGAAGLFMLGMPRLDPSIKIKDLDMVVRLPKGATLTDQVGVGDIRAAFQLGKKAAAKVEKILKAEGILSSSHYLADEILGGEIEISKGLVEAIVQVLPKNRQDNLDCGVEVADSLGALLSGPRLRIEFIRYLREVVAASPIGAVLDMDDMDACFVTKAGTLEFSSYTGDIEFSFKLMPHDEFAQVIQKEWVMPVDVVGDSSSLAQVAGPSYLAYRLLTGGVFKNYIFRSDKVLKIIQYSALVMGAESVEAGVKHKMLTAFGDVLSEERIPRLTRWSTQNRLVPNSKGDMIPREAGTKKQQAFAVAKRHLSEIRKGKIDRAGIEAIVNRELMNAGCEFADSAEFRVMLLGDSIVETFIELRDAVVSGNATGDVRMLLNRLSDLECPPTATNVLMSAFFLKRLCNRVIVQGVEKASEGEFPIEIAVRYSGHALDVASGIDEIARHVQECLEV